MVSREFCAKIPKVELHVHLEGSIRPETVLKLAKRNKVELPANTVEGLRDWYRFRSFPHFVEVYVAVSRCIQSPDDLELIAKEFLEGQAEQNILHSEVTYTACTIEKFNHIPWRDQHAALKNAIAYGEKELGVSLSLILDIVRGDPAERGMEVAEWAVGAHGDGVCALGVAGIEAICPLSRYQAAFDYAHASGVPVIPHAGETCGPESIWEALEVTKPVRIGHGVRCMEDPKLVELLKDRQIPLEVNPTSNVCLSVFPSLAAHPLPMMIEAGLYVTLNSDDPPMFGTTLTDEFYRCADAFDWSEEDVAGLCRKAAQVTLLPEDEKGALLSRVSPP